MRGAGQRARDARGWVRRHTRDPFDQSAADRVIVHCSHHKVGTVWMLNVLGTLATEYGLRVGGNGSSNSADVVLYDRAADFRPSHLGGRTYRGTHMIRDPRDVVVSGYHYHLWTTEEWVHLPQERFGGRTYQEHLRSQSPSDGLLTEIERSAGTVIRDMATWDYERPEFLELRYEQLLTNERSGFEQVFRHFGFNERAIARGLDIVDKHSFRNKAGRAVGQTSERTHLRSGAPGQWRAEFGPEHVQRFKELAGDALVQLGYEADTTW